MVCWLVCDLFHVLLIRMHILLLGGAFCKYQADLFKDFAQLCYVFVHCLADLFVQWSTEVLHYSCVYVYLGFYVQ